MLRDRGLHSAGLSFFADHTRQPAPSHLLVIRQTAVLQLSTGIDPLACRPQPGAEGLENHLRSADIGGVTATGGKNKGKSNAHLFRFDRQCGVDLVAGADEAGRAALAGPLVAAAVLFDCRTIRRPERRLLAELNDSKKISAAVRERVLPQVLGVAAATATVIVPPDEIDRVGLHRSNLNALVRALACLQLPGEAALPNDAALLVDGFALEGDRYRQVIRGDSKSAAIAAASIIAKTTRDRIMHEYAAVYPAYGFERHVGYITSAHSAAVVEHGPSPIHRLSHKARCYQQRLFGDPS